MANEINGNNGIIFSDIVFKDNFIQSSSYGSMNFYFYSFKN